MVGAVKNAEALAREAFRNRRIHLAELGQGDLNATEVIAALINLGESFEQGIRLVQGAVEGSCSLLILTREGIYAARDRFGRTPLILGQKEGAVAVSLESCPFPNLQYETVKDLGPGEVVFLTADGIEQRAGSPQYHAMEDWIRRRLNLTTLKYQLMDDLIAAIGLPKEKICTYCWDGSE